MQRHGFLTATAVGVASPAGRSDGTDTLGGGSPPSYRTNIPVRSATGGGSTFAHVGIPRLLEVDTLDSETDTPCRRPLSAAARGYWGQMELSTAPVRRVDTPACDMNEQRLGWCRYSAAAPPGDRVAGGGENERGGVGGNVPDNSGNSFDVTLLLR